MIDSLPLKLIQEISQELIEKVPYSFVKENNLLPLKVHEGEVFVAVSDPSEMDALKQLRFFLEKPIRAYFYPEPKLKELIQKHYYHKEGKAHQLLENLSDKDKDFCLGGVVSDYDLLEEDENSPVIRLINSIISEAIQQRSSDIHIDPLEESTSIRYRIDGILYLRHTVPRELQSQLVSRIKVMARLDVAERRLPQDGRIKLLLGNREIDFRISTIPIVYGERIVMRILDQENALVDFDALGMPKDVYREVSNLISSPEGILFVTGPTGSGKTTTLYSILKKIQNPKINIMSIEDPVEYHLNGIAQINVQPAIDLTFSKGLRHILRQDPDVILLGEVRDRETAKTSIQASLTGHLVLSTLHTNDAPSALTRLVDMGIEPYLLSSSVIGVCAQRLVRKLCSNCKESYTPTNRERECLGIEENIDFFAPKGCDVCFQSGFLGRQGLFELMLMDDLVKNQVLKLADSEALRRETKKQGFLTLKEHGAALVRKGITHSQEVLRVCRV